jgi:hypothetical protein
MATVGEEEGVEEGLGAVIVGFPHSPQGAHERNKRGHITELQF